MTEQYIREFITHEESLPAEERPFYHMNCAENLLRSAARQYDLDIPEQMFRIVVPYGAGMQTQNTCGALLGALGALGLLYSEDKPSKDLKMKAAVRAYVRRFQDEFGSLACAAIKPAFQDERRTCTPVKVRAGQLLDEVVTDIDAIYADYLKETGQ